MSFFAAEEGLDFKVKILLSEYFSVTQWSLNSRSRLIEDLNADSMDVVEIVMVVEGAFNVVLSPGQVSKWRCIADIVSSIAELTGRDLIVR